MKKKIAVLGCGYWGKNYIRNLADLDVLGTICDPDEDSLEKWHEKYPSVDFQTDHRVVFKNPEIDAVVVSTPSLTHYPLAREALLHNKDVLVEKPLTLNSQECEELIIIAQERKKILMVGHILQYHPAVIKLKDMHANLEFGKIHYIYSTRLNLGRFRMEENILWSFAPHDISIILGLIGNMPVNISAQGGNYLNRDITDVTITTMDFPDGVKAHIFVSWLHPFKEQKLVVIGEKQMAVFNDVRADKKLVVFNHKIEWNGKMPFPLQEAAKSVELEDAEPLKAQCTHFLECIETRETPLTDGREGLKVLQIIEACQKSLKAGGKVIPFGQKQTNYFIHETSWIDNYVSIGEGTKIWHFSHILENTSIGKKCNIGQNVVIGPNVTVGDNVKIQNNVSVYEGVTLEDDVFCGPSVVFTNVINPRSHWPRKDNFLKTVVRKGATLGANATVVSGITIGKYAFIGAGAVAVKSVPDYALVHGVPANLKGWICRCGTKLGFSVDRNSIESAKCCLCGRAYRKKGIIVSESSKEKKREQSNDC